MTDADILSDIRQGGAKRDKALQQLYNNDMLKKTILGYVTKQGGHLPDAEDVFQDTLVLFDRQIREGNFKGQSSLTTYFTGIAKWRWYSIRRKFRALVEPDPGNDAPTESIE